MMRGNPRALEAREQQLFFNTALLIIAFNRPDHTKRLLESLEKNPEYWKLPVYIFIDGPRNSNDTEKIRNVEDICRSRRPDAVISRSPKNKGLRQSVVKAVSTVLDRAEKIIVLEDDLIVSPAFLNYMLKGLETYTSDENVMSIHGYSIKGRFSTSSTYFLPGADCWGWGTWRRAWEHYTDDADLLLRELSARNLESKFSLNHKGPHLDLLVAAAEGTIDSWAIRWHTSAFLRGGVTLYPARSLVQNTGMDGSGTHSGNTKIYETPLSVVSPDVEHPNIKVSSRDLRVYERFYTKRRRAKKLLRRRDALIEGFSRVFRYSHGITKR